LPLPQDILTNEAVADLKETAPLTQDHKQFSGPAHHNNELNLKILMTSLTILLSIFVLTIGIIIYLPSHSQIVKMKKLKQAKSRRNNRQVAENSWAIPVCTVANRV